MRTVAAAALLLAACTAEQRTCVPAPGTTGSPANIAEVVDLINGLPRPVTVDCFLESLDRPLRLDATDSVFSLQPAVGRRNPRVFLFFSRLVVSVVPAGVGSNLVEFSEMSPDGSSVKAELAFPITESVLRHEEPYEHVAAAGGRTRCAFCHSQEIASHEVGTATAYRSVIFRPTRSSLVPLAALREEHLECDPEAEPERCAILRGLFGWGDVREQHFPVGLLNFFGTSD